MNKTCFSLFDLKTENVATFFVKTLVLGFFNRYIGKLFQSQMTMHPVYRKHVR